MHSARENFQRYTTHLFTWSQSSCVRERERREGGRGEREKGGEERERGRYWRYATRLLTWTQSSCVRYCSFSSTLLHGCPVETVGRWGWEGVVRGSAASVAHHVYTPSHHFSSCSTPGTGGQHETCTLECNEVARC